MFRISLYGWTGCGMSDKIHLGAYQGDVVRVGGKCYQFVGYEDEFPTHGAADGIFDMSDIFQRLKMRDY